MTAREFIENLLLELGETDLAKSVDRRLARNEDASLLLRFEADGTAREINLHFNQITVEME